MKILNVVGVRPNFIKIAPIIEQMNNSEKITCSLLHTGQHYDENMNKIFFDQLGIPSPDINLGVQGGSNAQQISEIMRKFESVLLKEKPKAILVVGDVNSTLACSMVAAYNDIRVIHIEAGLRSFDQTMPEEINRMLTDKISDLLFVTEESGMENLKKEGINHEKIHFSGNVMADTLIKHKDIAGSSSKILSKFKLSEKKYALVTMHRPSNVDCKSTLKGILQVLKRLSKILPVVFPIHPRTRSKISEFQLKALLQDLILTPPISYLDMVQLLSKSKLVLTDSGGIQEETTILGVPCLTLRKNTERPITISKGTNVLVGTDPEDIINAVKKVLDCNTNYKSCPKFWDGFASKRIVDVLENWQPK